MKYCKYCGQELQDEDLYCPNCGASTGEKKPEEASLTSGSAVESTSPSKPKTLTFGILGLIFSVLTPWGGFLIGIVFDILSLTLPKSSDMGRLLGKIGLLVFLGWLLLLGILLLVQGIQPERFPGAYYDI